MFFFFVFMFFFFFSFLFFFFLFFFFFSSRRRHTRCLSDWSSDVCSSDLTSSAARGPLRPSGRRPRAIGPAARPARRRARRARRPAAEAARAPTAARSREDGAGGSRTRSEERRVGKECRERRAPENDRRNV